MNYATFYTTSNRIIIIIIIISINLLGSHWLLSVSVLEVKVSDWLRVKDHRFLKQTEAGGPNLGRSLVCFWVPRGQKYEPVLNRSWFSGL